MYATFALAALACVGFVAATIYFKEPPQQVWARIVTTFETLIAGESPVAAPAVPPPTPSDLAPESDPEFVSMPEPEPMPEPVPESPPVEAPSEKPVAAVDALVWLAQNRHRWPREIALLEPAEFTILDAGQVVGSTTVPAGRRVRLLAIDSGIITIGQGTLSRRVLVETTDLRQRAEAIMAAPAPQLYSIAKPQPSSTPAAPPVVASSAGFVHPGMLHNEDDFLRMRNHLGREPWKSGWERLITNRHCSLEWKPAAVEVVIRGTAPWLKEPQNYGRLFHDAAAAYACALRWKVSGDRAYAEKAIEILNAWSAVLKRVTGSSDAALAAGLQGYQFANAGEIMRTYKGWKPAEFERFKKMMSGVFLPFNLVFLKEHFKRSDDHYWANWDLANMASVMAIGILCDDRTTYEKAVTYFKFGKGNGAIENAVYYVHPGNLGQWQESGRDQGHTTMGVPIMATICEMAWKQGDDLYGYDNNRFLAGCEYIAKYNLGEEVPYKEYRGSTEVSPAGRGMLRPGWELVYNHYVIRKGLSAPWSIKMAEKVRPEGGGEGPNSGGYDQLGYGTLTATLDKQTTAPKAFGQRNSQP